MVVSRTKVPKVSPMAHWALPKPTIYPLNRDVDLLGYVAPGYPALALDIFWRAGESYGAGAIPHFMGKMLRKGTAQRSGSAIAETFEQYGAQLSFHIDKESLHVRLLSLPDYFERLVPRLLEVLQAPSFPNGPLATLKNVRARKLARKLADPSFLAHKELKTLMFGDAHPYGHTFTEAEIEAVTSQDLTAYHERVAWHEPFLVVSGSPTSSSMERLKELLASITPAAPVAASHAVEPGAQEKEIPHPGSLQTTLALGHPTITQAHPDYPDLFITNALLGGYFGARLMRTLREEKGYTYGVYSRLVPWVQEGYWYISTSVKKEAAADAYRAIQEEIEELQRTLVKEKELTVLKNYLQGKVLSMFQTPFALAERLAQVRLHGFDLDYYMRLYQRIDEMTPEKIRTAAQRYFHIKDLHTVRVVPGGA